MYYKERGMNMRRIAVIYGEAVTDIQKKALEALSRLLLDYTYEYPTCVTCEEADALVGYQKIYIGTKENNPYIGLHSPAQLTFPESYAIRVKDGIAVIQGFDDAGVLYGCMDFYNKYLLRCEYPHDDRYHIPVFEDTLPDFFLASAPSVANRGIWTWGHVIYDYRNFIDHMVMLKMNSIVIWNDFVPVNGADMVAYAHSCGIRIIWGYAWCWDTNCAKFSLETIDENIDEIIQKYEKEYAPLGGDGIYFQSFTELNEETIGGILIAQAVTDFVNKTAARFYEKYPDLELQFGLHSNSVKDKLEFIKHVNPDIRIVWENCGSFPFSYIPIDVSRFDETTDFVRRIAVLRGPEDKFGVVTKGLTKLDWRAFKHLEGPVHPGVSSTFMKTDRIIRKHKIWKYIQAYWLTHADKVYEMVQTLVNAKHGDLYIMALVEDGMFEEQIMYPIALYSEMLWDCTEDLKKIMSETALRDYVDFA